MSNFGNGKGKPVTGDDDDDEDEGNERDLEAWERAYADERSWESLQEDESGLLRPIDNQALHHAQYRRRLRSLSSASATSRIQKGLIRYLYLVIDLSRVYKSSHAAFHSKKKMRFTFSLVVKMLIFNSQIDSDFELMK